MKMIAVWVLAFALYGPAIIFWELAVGRSRVPMDECFAEFYHSWYFLLSASMLEFFTPLISVAFFNLSIYLNIRRRRLNSRKVQLQQQMSEPASAQGEGTPLSNTLGYGVKMALRGSIHSQSSSPTIGKPDPSPGRVAQPSRLSRDKKIAKSLAIIVCVFAICWAPYTLLMIIRAACRGRCIQHHWYEVTFWLLWLNSAINPFLYPLCHSSFRRAFSRILCAKRLGAPSSVPRAGLWPADRWQSTDGQTWTDTHGHPNAQVPAKNLLHLHHKPVRSNRSKHICNFQYCCVRLVGKHVDRILLNIVILTCIDCTMYFYCVYLQRSGKEMQRKKIICTTDFF